MPKDLGGEAMFTTDPPHVQGSARDQASLRERGKAQLRAVYGWDFEPTKPFEVETVDHLFGEVWCQGDLTVKERRLMLIGMAVGTGQTDVATMQLSSALELGELSPEDLRTIVVFLAHYAGWPRAASLSGQVEELIASHKSAHNGSSAKPASSQATSSRATSSESGSAAQKESDSDTRRASAERKAG